MTTEDIKPGKIYRAYLGELSKEFFLVLKKKETKDAFNPHPSRVRLEFLWLTGKKQGVFDSGYLYERVYYAIEEVQMLPL